MHQKKSRSGIAVRGAAAVAFLAATPFLIAVSRSNRAPLVNGMPPVTARERKVHAFTPSAVISNLPPAKYYFVISAYDTAGAESDYSISVSKTIN